MQYLSPLLVRGMNKLHRIAFRICLLSLKDVVLTLKVMFNKTFKSEHYAKDCADQYRITAYGLHQ